MSLDAMVGLQVRGSLRERQTADVNATLPLVRTCFNQRIVLAPRPQC